MAERRHVLKRMGSNPGALESFGCKAEHSGHRATRPVLHLSHKVLHGGQAGTTHTSPPNFYLSGSRVEGEGYLNFSAITQQWLLQHTGSDSRVGIV